jgi:hypothetical protein
MPLKDEVECDRLTSWDKIIKRQEKGWIFRGQPDAGWTFKSSLERLCDDFNLDCLTAERAIVSEFKRRYHQYSHLSPSPTDNLEWLSIMRHYGCPTRLLDWTYSIYIALYFALEKSKGDASLWALRGQWLDDEGGKILRKSRVRAETVKAFTIWPKFAEDERLFTRVFLNNKNPVPLAFVVCPKRLTQRLSLQKGLFLCPGDVSKTFEENILAVEGHNDRNNLVKLVVPKEKRIEYLWHLDNMNINRTSLFPGLEGFASAMGVYYHLYNQGELEQSVYAGKKGACVWD